MVFATLMRAARPLIILWAGLNAIDDISILLRVARLAMVVIPGVEKENLCGVCDDVMGDLLKGSSGLDAVPCAWACLRVPQCMRMCENIKAASTNSSRFPCFAAGYCDPIQEGAIDTDVECSVAFPLRCTPAQYCQRHRAGLRMSCKLRPGIGRWVGMRNAVGSHAAALRDGLLSQPHCGQPNAGPYCIAEPTGLGVVAEAVGHVLSLLYGGLRTVVSIETAGGDDDRQWLTFWLIFTLLLFLERYLARVVLSTCPMYYELKFCLLVWLLFCEGADATYRSLRAVLGCRLRSGLNTLFRLQSTDEAEADARQLEELKAEFKELVAAAEAAEKRRQQQSPSLKLPRERQYQELSADDEATHHHATHELRAIYEFIFTPEGAAMLAQAPDAEATRSGGLDKTVLLERAAARLSFQPRVLKIDLVGVPTEDGAAAAFPPVDDRHDPNAVDPYIVFQLLPPAEAVGTAWVRVGRQKPSRGTELIHSELATALKDRQHFSPAEVEQLSVDGLEADSFIKVGDEYFAQGAKVQAPYPPRGVRSVTKTRDARPTWNQSFELTLRGGAIDDDGYHRSGATATATRLRVRVFDADVGVWGFVLGLATTGAMVLVGAVATGHILGLTDNLTKQQQRLLEGAAILVTLLIAVAMMNKLYWHTEDDLIGEVEMPLRALMDQETHTYKLEFHAEPDSPVMLNAPPPVTRCKSKREAHNSGSVGRVTLRLTYSER